MAWRCPYCQQIATLLSPNQSRHMEPVELQTKHNFVLAIVTNVIACPNTDCREYTIDAYLYKAAKDYPSYPYKTEGKPLMTWTLKPQSAAKPQPDYIPSQIRQDYEEACLIASPSPKASATLARRCLQGIIRDFWGISKSRLVDEIAALEQKIDSTTWSAIDAVRSIGNIGAHMEKDINLIVDVDEGEAQLLINLLEILFEEWYVHRHERDQKMKAIVGAAEAKKNLKNVVAPE